MADNSDQFPTSQPQEPVNPQFAGERTLSPPTTNPGDIFDTSGFSRSWITYVALFILIAFPLSNLIATGDPSEVIKLLGQNPMVFYITTIVFLWGLFAMVYIAVWQEGQTLRSLGFTGLRGLHLLQGFTFFLVSAIILKGLEVILAELGYHSIGELSLLLPDTALERVMWVALSITAGVCEEAAFRGYFITRFRELTPAGWPSKVRWLAPVALSALVFGLGHTYQGVSGFVMITAYGIMISLLFLYTRSIWPAIFAHFLLDFINLFVPLLESNTN
jgi:CAAX protease family protein